MTRTTQATRAQVVARLVAAQKSNKGAAGYSRWVNRRVGRQIAATAYLRGLTPNQISAISAIFTFSALICLATLRPTWPAGIGISLALLVGYAFDSADGQVARLRGGGTPAGEWLDHVLDAVKASGFHVAVAIMWFRWFDLDDAAWLLIPLGFAVVAASFFFAMILTDMLRRIARASAGRTTVTTSSLNPTEHAPILRSLIVLPNDYGVLALSIVLIAAHTPFRWIYTLLFAANVVFLVVGCARWFQEMRLLATGSPRDTVD